MQGRLFLLYGGNTSDKYVVKLYTRAYRDLDDIYTYIAETLLERGAIRRSGAYANGKYRQLFVKNYCVIYRLMKKKKEVHIVTVRYTPSSF